MYNDPMDCRKYYDCVGGITWHRTGPAVGLMFDSAKKKFSHSNEVNCTIKKGELNLDNLKKKSNNYFLTSRHYCEAHLI